MPAEHSTREPLAIVGIGCHFPGGAHTPHSYWNLLCSEIDATCTVPETRWNAEKYYDPNPAKVGKMVTRRGGFLSEIDQFDPQFFGISPREANLVDPQQRLLLQTTWEALEDGGIAPDSLAGTEVGVFIGGFTLDYQLLQNQGRASRYRFKTHSATGMMMTMLANRISFAFDFRGPSMTVDTACSSSLVAVHLAALSIWNGECDLALAGGVNIMIGPNTAIAESKSGFLSPDGRCKAFDDSADGYARGEGGAVVVIKPLQRALADGDEIYAQILGTAVSQDGRTDGITVPSAEAQEAAITTALRRAGVRPGEVGYVEAHGTGTPVGDPIEVRALANVLAAERPASDPLLIGSVKTNIGHLEAGAGVAGLIKAALVLKHGYIPANLHLKNPIALGSSGLAVAGTSRPFPGDGRRVAGVNSFGFGGTNAHVVLAEPPAAVRAETSNHAQRPPLAVLPISARTEEALVATAGRLAEHLRAHPDLALHDLGYTLSRRRSHLKYRGALVADSIADALDQLEAFAEGRRSPAGRTPPTSPKLAFVCTGMGPQWWKMCRGLLDVYPAFTDSILRSDRELARYADWSLIDELRADEPGSRMAETDIAQPANFAIQIAIAEQLKQFGVNPDAVIGHSAGEVAAHYLAGVLTFEQAIRVIYHRSRLQQRTRGLGRMLAVGLSAEALTQWIDGATFDHVGGRVSIAAVNSPSAVTVAGDSDVLEEIARQLDERNVFNKFLAVEVPYHTHYMDAVRDDLHSALDGLSSKAATIPLYSTVTGERLEGYAAGAAYWWQNTRATVLFEPAVTRMLDEGYTHFVELGPHPVLAPSIAEIAAAQNKDIVVLASQRRNEDDSRTLMNCVAALHCHGHPVGWDALYPSQAARPVKLPSYPWQFRRYWNETQEAAEDLHYNPVHPLLGQAVSAVHPTWELELSTATVPFIADHQVQGSVLLPGAAYIEMALAAGEEAYGSADHRVENLTLHRALILDDTCDPILRTTLNQDTGMLEFAAFTATAGGELKWTITATAELNARPRSPGRHDFPSATGQVITIDGDEFYSRTRAVGLAYGDAFQTITDATAGDGWATARIAIPASLTGEVARYRFHPALIDGAFQTLLGTSLFRRDANESPYLPVRIRRSAIYGAPEENMTVQVRVVSATEDEIASDIAIVGDDGQPLAVFNGFTVQSLSASSSMSPERVDKGLYEIEWVAQSGVEHDHRENPVTPEGMSWLIFIDAAGVGSALAERMRRSGQRVRTVEHRHVQSLAELDDGYALNPRQPRQLHQLLETHLAREGQLAGIINCWPMNIRPHPDVPETNDQIGVFAILHLVKALAEHDIVQPRLYVVTANAQPAPGTEALAVEQAVVWGLGRVVGHQEFVKQWGGLIDIDAADDHVETATRICEHVLGDDPEDQIAVRGSKTFVPRLRPSGSLTKVFPAKLTPDATYVVTGGAGALGRTIATYLAQRGARHIALLCRSEIPSRSCWPSLSDDHRHRSTVDAIRHIEHLGARVTTASVDVTDANQVEAWLSRHLRDGGPPVRGIIHAAGSVDDQLLVNMTEADFAAVMAPKVTGTRVLHNSFKEHELEFFVMFGSAGSVIAAPGQGNYAAANAFLDAFAHYRQSEGLPALTIGWGPWSVGMVEELKLEKIYAQRGIELITPAAGTQILDRLINQKAPNVIAITVDWTRARRVGLVGQLPPMFSELGTADAAIDDTDSESSILDALSGCPQAERLDMVARLVRQIVSAVFEVAVTEIGPEDALDDLGLDSMMAMDFRTRIGATFAIDLPVLELLRGVSVNSLAVRILGELQLSCADPPGLDEQRPDATTSDDIDRLIEQLSEADLREVLADLQRRPTERGTGGPQS
ncbi:mycocerosic acid synthase [Mycobacterium mantenii]|uniref:Mycocerosic acid synthase n=1 Tax=Mycobacterium mantenii TaxID=560555 RepID=A0A1X0G0R0_MYCNT|nr:type I polyketide synthase [Mycobacterium mantenii]ORB07405.1 polyketide synthase [Mycobacterium mantenii]BBY38314.1 mycocerosic acid synthase [Mycobacterium mantenii]